MKPSSDIDLFTTTLPFPVLVSLNLFLRRTLGCSRDPFRRLLGRHSCHPLALAACGSSPSGGAKPGGARPSGQEPTAAVSAPPPLSVRTGNMTQLFATPLLGNAQSAEVVAGFRQDMILYDMSQEGRRLITPVTDYVTGSMLKALERTISDFTEAVRLDPGNATAKYDLEGLLYLYKPLSHGVPPPLLRQKSSAGLQGGSGGSPGSSGGAGGF